jgi:hypothetical protein
MLGTPRPIKLRWDLIDSARGELTRDWQWVYLGHVCAEPRPDAVTYGPAGGPAVSLRRYNYCQPTRERGLRACEVYVSKDFGSRTVYWAWSRHYPQPTAASETWATMTAAILARLELQRKKPEM